MYTCWRRHRRNAVNCWLSQHWTRVFQKTRRRIFNLSTSRALGSCWHKHTCAFSHTKSFKAHLRHFYVHFSLQNNMLSFISSLYNCADCVFLLINQHWVNKKSESWTRLCVWWKLKLPLLLCSYKHILSKNHMLVYFLEEAFIMNYSEWF